MYHYAEDTIIIALKWGLRAQLFLQSRRVIDIALSISNNGDDFTISVCSKHSPHGAFHDPYAVA